jgi:hypothetical protein
MSSVVSGPCFINSAGVTRGAGRHRVAQSSTFTHFRAGTRRRGLIMQDHSLIISKYIIFHYNFYLCMYLGAARTFGKRLPDSQYNRPYDTYETNDQDPLMFPGFRKPVRRAAKQARFNSLLPIVTSTPQRQALPRISPQTLNRCAPLLQSYLLRRRRPARGPNARRSAYAASTGCSTSYRL